MTLSQLKSDIDFLAGSTSATYYDSDKTRNLNIAYQDTARLIWESAGGWQYDDSNSTTLPIARTSLVHSQQDYELPSTAQRVQEIVVKDGQGHDVKLLPIDIADFTQAPRQTLSTPGLPMYYDLVGRSVMLYPPPASGSVTLASGIGFYVNRDIDEFPVSGTTTVPGFPPAFHRILSTAAAIDFTQDKDQRDFLISQKTRLQQGLVRFYSKRDVQYKARLKPQSKKYWRQYT